MMEMIVLRAASSDDKLYLYHLHRATMSDLVEQIWGWDEPVQQEFFREHIAAGNHFLIQLKDENVGTVQYHDEADHIFIGNIEIDPDRQGEGIGTEVIQQLIKRAHAENKPVRLQVLKINTSACRLYQRLGFGFDDETDTHHHMTTRPR
ncbi:MAG: GNAT family N-acetyltransferase [Thermomicrobiales bacterium]